MVWYGWFSLRLGWFGDARATLCQALPLLEASDARRDKALAYLFIGATCLHLHGVIAARPVARRGLAISQEIGDCWGSAYAGIVLGEVASALSEYEEAERQYRASLAYWHELHAWHAIVLVLSLLGEVECRIGNYAGAAELLAASLDHAHAARDRARRPGGRSSGLRRRDPHARRAAPRHARGPRASGCLRAGWPTAPGGLGGPQ
jgi:tetratricopeptide (TPR) repeat protein